MKVIDRLKEGFYNSDFYISVYPRHIYIINYIEIIDFSNTKLKIRFTDFILLVKGLDFKIKRKNKYELDIEGNFSSMELLNE